LLMAVPALNQFALPRLLADWSRHALLDDSFF